jgi:NAD(P)-dependent dehydrogenase (short-subunit alcohol dehydrogenase family)
LTQDPHLCTFVRNADEVDLIAELELMVESPATVEDSLKPFRLAGRSIVITGAAGALGSAAARALYQAGARLTLAGGNERGLESLVAELRGTGEASVVPVRPEDPRTAEEIVVAAADAFGSVDGLLVASGVNHVAPIVDMSVADFDRVQSANVRGSWLMCQAVGRRLLAQGTGGSVVLVSSTRGRLGHPAGYSAYCPSKAAVDLLVKSLAAEWGSHQIRVNALAPTVFRSELTAWMYQDDARGRATREAMLARIPLGRLAEPEDFVGALVYLLSDASAFLTGQVIYLDGGYTAC